MAHGCRVHVLRDMLGATECGLLQLVSKSLDVEPLPRTIRDRHGTTSAKVGDQRDRRLKAAACRPLQHDVV